MRRAGALFLIVGMSLSVRAAPTGGCSIAGGADAIDITLGVLVALLGVALLLRRTRWFNAATRSRRCKKRDDRGLQDGVEKAKV
ncbi:MAG TPA: MYXO-CTERM sorting domain-containing protein [Polyangia bacterium]|nr:MYXO-CTERM sorting domain-containing protein [Polyangia bacterium]